MLSREIVGAAVTKRNYPNERHRRSLRLQGYDYAERGAYFVTICTKNRACLLGDITNGEMRLNDFGRLAKAAWEEIPSHFPDIELGTFVAMPNHIHGIIVIARPTPRATRASPLQIAPGPPKRSLGTIVGSYKSAVTKGINQSRGAAGAPVWQRNYYEHIIRDDADLNRIRQYIWDNPARWQEDPDNPYLIRKYQVTPPPE